MRKPEKELKSYPKAEGPQIPSTYDVAGNILPKGVESTCLDYPGQSNFLKLPKSLTERLRWKCALPALRHYDKQTSKDSGHIRQRKSARLQTSECVSALTASTGGEEGGN